MNTGSHSKIEELSFIRVICAIGIVVYHYNGAVACEVKPFYHIANGWWGTVLVTIFFAISGAVLYYNYPKVSSIRAFYWKRWKAIYPAFYLCFLFFFLQNVLRIGLFFYEGRPASLILSVFALDGYFLYLIPNYYLVGEWFLGAIILLYLLYPLINYLFRKIPVIFSILVSACYLVVLFTNFFKIDLSRNLFTCLFSFLFGMIAIKNIQLLTKKGVLIGAAVLSVVLMLVPIPVSSNLTQHILGFALFVALFGAGKYVMKVRFFHWAISQLDLISYPIFLFHRMIIDKFLQFRNPETLGFSILWCIVILVMTIICAKILSVVVNSILNSRIMKKIDVFMCRDSRKQKNTEVS